MSSIWSSGLSQGGQGTVSPFATNGMSPMPGGAKTSRAMSLLQSGGAQSGARAGMVPTAVRATSSNAKGAVSVNPMDSSSGSSSSNTAGTITSNDFLTLLVTEMQNQDPTAQTDPNEYINQLVQINSLEQLISINQNLADVLGAATSSGSTSSGSPSAATAESTVHSSVQPKTAEVSGNLTEPQSAPAAHTVAHSLDGRARGAGHGHTIRDIPTH
jgi:flagellar basal-body rod modification protein FlgD